MITKDTHPDIAWLFENDKHGLWDYQASAIIRILIDKVNELESKIEKLESEKQDKPQIPFPM